MRYFGFAFLLASASALACPDLTGTYATCSSLRGSDDQLSDVVITQDGTTYVMNATDDDGDRTASTIYADGREMTVAETDDDTGLTFITTTTGSCSDTALTLASTVTVNGQQIGTMNNQVTSANGVLTQEITGEILGQEVTDTITCQ